MFSVDPGPPLCGFCDFYECEGILTPIHECPAPAPLEPDDLERPLTDLERRQVAQFIAGTMR